MTALEDQAPVVETVVVLESHIDHLTGEELGYAFDRLQAAGAKDVLWLPGVMKKNRPGGALRAICLPADLDAVQAAFFKHTHTLGIRRAFMERVILPRAAGTVAGPQGEALDAKLYRVEGETYTRVEFEALVKAAVKAGGSLPGMRFTSRD